jgi:hypothetical protein
MKITFAFAALALGLFTAAVQAQSGGGLNLKLPPGGLPAASSSTAAVRPAAGDAPPAMETPAQRPAAAGTAAARPAPGVYYGDTSGRTAAQDEAEAEASRPRCDDATYNQPQVHGSVGMGVVSGRHWGGSYDTGAVNITQRTGSCDHPTGSLGVSIGVSRFGRH